MKLPSGFLLMGMLTISGLAAAKPAVDPLVPGALNARSVRVDDVDYPVQIFVPKHYQPKQSYPLVLFLHGSGERGSEGLKQARVGLGPYVLSHAEDFPAIVVMPQSPDGSSWNGAVAKAALAAVDLAQAEFSIDPDRVYLTGMSRGGYGVWDLAAMAPDRFAALVPVCGGVETIKHDEPIFVAAVAGARDPYRSLARKIGAIPVWIFHGALDDVVPTSGSRQMFAVLHSRGADVRYTEFEHANHNAWDPTYQSKELWEWLFVQRLGVRRQ
jgi:predicted peptidase